MGIFHNFPWTSFQEANFDWLIKQTKKNTEDISKLTAEPPAEIVVDGEVITMYTIIEDNSNNTFTTNIESVYDLYNEIRSLQKRVLFYYIQWNSTTNKTYHEIYAYRCNVGITGTLLLRLGFDIEDSYEDYISLIDNMIRLKQSTSEQAIQISHIQNVYKILPYVEPENEAREITDEDTEETEERTA